MFEESGSPDVEILPRITTVLDGFPLEQSDPMFRPDEVALWLRIPERDLSAMRRRGDGPAFVKVKDRSVRYLLSDLKGWIASNRFRSARPIKHSHYSRIHLAA